jgi:hypothetical protein
MDTRPHGNSGILALPWPESRPPASILADLTGISISTAERWSRWDWAAYVGQRAAEDRNGIDRVETC